MVNEPSAASFEFAHRQAGRSHRGATSSSSTTSAAAPSTPRCSSSRGPATRCSTPSVSTGWAATTLTRSWPPQPCGAGPARDELSGSRGQRCSRSAARRRKASPRSPVGSPLKCPPQPAPVRVVTVAVDDFYAAATSLVEATTAAMEPLVQSLASPTDEGTGSRESPGSTSSAGRAPCRLSPGCCERASAAACTARRCRAPRPPSDWPSPPTPAPGSRCATDSRAASVSSASGRVGPRCPSTPSSTDPW